MTSYSINPNVRSAVAFSAKRDVMRSPQAQAPSSQPRFGALPLYSGPYNNVHILTDFQDQSSNARIHQRFQEVQQFIAPHHPVNNPLKRLSRWFNPNKTATKQAKSLKGFGWDQSPIWKKESRTGILDHSSNISDIPLRNIDAASQTLFELAHAPNRDIFVHVTDPGVGSGQEAHKRSILVSDRHGVHVGPNNGSLGLLAKFLEQKKEPFKVLEIDLDKVRDLENLRTGSKHADNGSTFHGRDVFGVAAAAIAAGLAPEALSKKQPIQPVYSAFAQQSHLPARKGDQVAVHANRDNTSGNLVLNVPLKPEAFKVLRDENAQYVLKAENGHTLTLPAQKTFGEVRQGEPLLYLGSKNAVSQGQRYIEVAINCGDISERLNLPRQEKAYRFELTRL